MLEWQTMECFWNLPNVASDDPKETIVSDCLAVSATTGMLGQFQGYDAISHQNVCNNR